jgi:hypothetical protein
VRFEPGAAVQQPSTLTTKPCCTLCYNIVVVVKVAISDKRLAIELSFSAGLGLKKPNSDRDRGETFFPNSGSDLDSDKTFQISRNLGLDIDEIVCLLDSQLCHGWMLVGGGGAIVTKDLTPPWRSAD